MLFLQLKCHRTTQIFSSAALVAQGLYHLISVNRNHLKFPADYVAKPFHPLPSTAAHHHHHRWRHLQLYLIIVCLLIAIINQLIVSSDSDPLVKGRTAVHLFTSLQSAALLSAFLLLTLVLLLSDATSLLPLPLDLFFAIAAALFFVNEIAKSSALQPHVANFLSILVDMKRIDLVKEIVKEFEAVYNDLTATELAVVTSVVKLESQHLAQIAKGVQKLTGAKNVRIKTAIDPGLVAGFTIRYGNSGSKLIDMSVKKQLEEIAAQLDLGDIQLAV